ncbi:MAG: 23S rRNA (guanosine(2251)-2'-O)-methyltransferase RlmB [Polyangiales bacterium]
MKRYLCGVRAVVEALRADPRNLIMVHVSDASPRGALSEVVQLAQAAKVLVEPASSAQLEALAKGVRHQGVVAVSGADYPYLDLDALLLRARSLSDAPLLVALDEVTDPHNFGAIVRSAVALGAHGVITLKDRAAPVTSTVVRASAGATEHAAIARVTNLSRALERLAKEGFTSVGLAGEAAEPLRALDLRGPLALVVGSEGSGLRRLVRERCDHLARIDLVGPVTSLNASVAAGVALYEAVRQRG